ncbi:hypothetical protein SBADM41S_09145 [Streptomyces badius]
MNATSTGALLLCRADPETVRPLAHLLREQMLLVRAGEEWSVLVPEGKPWRAGGAEQDAEPVDRILGGWATALAVGSTWPVLALWWDADRAGYTLAAGFRRPVGYIWLTDGTPVGEDEAMRTFAARLGLDPVLDVQALEELTRPDPETDAEARLRGLLAVLAGAGLTLPAGLSPGESADRLRSVAAAQRQVDRVEWPAGAMPYGSNWTRSRAAGSVHGYAAPAPGPSPPSSSRPGSRSCCGARGAAAVAGRRPARCSWRRARWGSRTSGPGRAPKARGCLDLTRPRRPAGPATSRGARRAPRSRG